MGEITIRIPESQLSMFRETYMAKRKVLRSELEVINSERLALDAREQRVREFLRETETMLEQLNGTAQIDLPFKTSESLVAPDGYSIHMIWEDKVQYVVEHSETPLKREGIVEELKKIDGELAMKDNQYVEKNVSPVLAGMKKKGALIAYRIKGEKGYYYLPKSFYDVGGNLKAEHMNKITAEMERMNSEES